MGKPKLDKTQSTFSKDDISTNREYSTRRDNDKVRKISVTIYDIDHAVKWHIQNVIRPTINEDGNMVSVPTMFSTGEKWASAQRNGFLRDKNGMLLTPLIMIRRTGMDPRTDLENNNVLRGISYNTGNKMLFEKRYTAANRYDRFSVYNKITPMREFFAVDFPKFVSVNYDLLIWTNGMEQLNDICEQFIYYDGKAWGDAYKFITYTDTPSFDVVNDTGADRLVRAAFSMRTQAHLIPDRTSNDSGLEKFYGVTKTMIATETEVTPEELYDTFAERQAKVMDMISNAGKTEPTVQSTNTEQNKNQLPPSTGTPTNTNPPIVSPGSDGLQWPRPDSIL